MTKPTRKTCATREDTDQPAHLHSLIRVFADCMYFYSLWAIQRWMNENP